MRIAIIGTTGMLGHHAARAVVARQHELVVVRRATSKLALLGDLKFDSVVADLDDRGTLSRALDGVDAVINCAGHYPTRPRPWQEDVRIGTAQMENFYAACEGKKLHKIVYLGGAIALRRHPQGLPGDETLEYAGEPEDKNPYLQVKWAMDAQAKDKARAGLPVTIGIPTMSFGEFDAGPTTGRLIVEIANGTLPGYVRGNRNVVYAGDAGVGLVRVCEDGRPGERYLLTGENLPMDDVVGKIAHAAGKPVPRAIPLRVARIVSAIQTWRCKHLNGPVPKVDATAIAVMSSGQFLDGKKAADELGYRPRVSVDEAIERALRWFRENGYVR